MRTIFLNRFYWPDEPATAQLLTDLAEALAARGHEVVVLTSHPDRPEVPAEETRRGVRILRVRGTRWASHRLPGKAADYASFYVVALWRLLLITRHDDNVVALTDPPLIGIGAWAVSMLRGARLFHWVQDIYPEVAIQLAGQRWLTVLRPLRDLAWRRATRCITLGTDMAALLTAARVAPDRISLAPNWAPAGLTPQPASAGNTLRADWGLTGKFVVAYSGNLGRVHDLDPVLAVAAELRGDPRIVFLFVGGGARRGALEAEAARLGLDNLQFRPSQPRAQLTASLAVGDVHLVTLLPGCEHTVFPSKLYGIAAIGRPVVFIGPRDCELSRLVTYPALRFGVAFERSEPVLIAASLRTLASDPAECARLAAASVEFARRNGGAETAAARWDAWLSRCELAASAHPAI